VGDCPEASIFGAVGDEGLYTEREVDLVVLDDSLDIETVI
jgi:hypothetical protein